MSFIRFSSHSLASADFASANMMIREARLGKAAPLDLTNDALGKNVRCDHHHGGAQGCGRRLFNLQRVSGSIRVFRPERARCSGCYPFVAPKRMRVVADVRRLAGGLSRG